MEIKDNTFARQFETIINESLISIEYSFQERKFFLTRINKPDDFDDENSINDFIKNILEIIEEKNFRVVPVHPKIAVFFRKNTKYKYLLPPGIKL